MKTAEELKQAVDEYIVAKGYELKKSYFSPFDNVYNVTTTDYTELEGKLVKCKNGKMKLVFKVDGKVRSIKHNKGEN